MKIAQFKLIGHTDFGIRTLWPQDRMNEHGTISGYVRTSDWIEVEFSDRDDSSVPEEISQLDQKLEEIKADFTRKVGAIEEAKAKLLALTDERCKA